MSDDPNRSTQTARRVVGKHGTIADYALRGAQASAGESLVAAGIKPSSPWQIIHQMGVRITPEIAEVLSAATGASVQMFLNLQDAYDLGESTNAE